jgi:hypothetical protein
VAVVLLLVEQILHSGVDGKAVANLAVPFWNLLSLEWIH